MKRLIELLILAVLPLTACVSPGRSVNEDSVRLGLAIGRLSPVVDPEEAQGAATLLTRHSLRLAEEYDSIRVAWLQNVLVNTGMKDRGLCYHWVNDLMPIVEQAGFQSLVFYRMGSRVGTRREHNVLTVSADGDGPEKGLVIDSWRYQGRVHWIEASKDKRDWIRLWPRDDLAMTSR